MSDPQKARIHPTAIVEEDVVLGEGTSVWDGVHIRHGARIGKSCSIGEKTYLAYDVVVGSFVKINASVYICTGVTIEDFCMISAHTVFTNDRFPRAGNVDLTGLQTSDPTEETLHTRICRGATIGANVTIGPGVILGEFCMVGMGSVVTKDVKPFSLVAGNPARPLGWVCMCGHPLQLQGDTSGPAAKEMVCARCQRAYRLEAEAVSLFCDSRRRV